MVNVGAVEEMLREYLEKARDPYLNSMKSLPATVFDELVHEMVRSAECQVSDDSMSLVFNMKRFRRRVRSAMRANIMDEVGLLLQYGASKSVISEVTGVLQYKIKERRKKMNLASPRQGRPRKLDKAQMHMIQNIWTKSEGCKTVRLIKTHEYSDFPINDVWLVVRDLKPTFGVEEAGGVRQCN